jgi:four helix bundle protein
MKFDLEYRTLEFGKSVLRICKILPKNDQNRRLSDQLVRSGTSIGANYMEANETDARRDFSNKIRIAKKEAKESLYWIDLLIEINISLKSELEGLKDECYQLVKILAAIYEKSKA